ncbi:MAG: hypothetical protein Q9220_007706 [cf. Caloplaca sp. 1 TL-2023]
MSEKGKHALVFGASGLIGWGVVDQLLSNYPTKSTFAQITALINRPLDIEDAYWPDDLPGRPELQLVTGVNLVESTVDSMTKLLQTKVKDIESVTHVFYFVYKSEQAPEEEVREYGIYIPGGIFTPPYEESMGPLPEAAQNTIHYPAFRQILKDASAGRRWSWCDIRPDAVIGFAPNGSTFNLTAHWATYLSLYARVEGKGAKIPFPGTMQGYTSRYNEASAEIIAKCAIWAGIHPTETGGQEFNIADQARPESMQQRWPALAAYFGLEGTAPVDDDQHALKPSEYIDKHRNVLEDSGLSGSLAFRGDMLDGYGYHLDFDRHLSLDKVRKAGFTEELDPNASWFKAFALFKKAKMILS